MAANGMIINHLKAHIPLKIKGILIHKTLSVTNLSATAKSGEKRQALKAKADASVND